MRALLLVLFVLSFQTDIYSCSWSPRSFCTTIEDLASPNTNLIVVSGVVSQTDQDGVDLDIIEVLEGIETRSTIRIWDGTDFDCNGLHSMAAADFLPLGDSVIVVLPLLDSIINTWDQLGDYRMPMPWGQNPILKIIDGVVTGSIIGNYFQDHSIHELPYDYFVNEFIGSGLCDLESPNLHVRFFYDKDQNGYKSFDENYLPIGGIELPGLGQVQNFKSTGLYLYVPEGPLTLTFDQSLVTDWTTSIQDVFELNISSFGFNGANIGVIPTSEYSNVVYNIVNPNFRCGEEIDFELVATNEGTTPASGVFWFKLDSRLDTYVFEEDPDYFDQNEGIYGWEYEDLGPYESIRIPLTITAPLITDPNQIAEIYILKMADTFNNTLDAVFCYELELRCAFDPNDKQASPIRDDQLALDSLPLRYTIRFQNTGNDYARDVIIRDTLDENLDLSTFKLVSTSHPRNLTISSDRGFDKKFEFKNIFLPDSLSNEPESHGYLSFTIKVNEGTPLKTEVNNNASIYFDFNPPILTNTVTRIMVDKFPISNTNNVESHDIHFSPNPASDRIVFEREIDEFTLYDLSGRQLHKDQNISQLSLSDIKEGAYIMLLSDGKRKVTKRLVVIK